MPAAPVEKDHGPLTVAIIGAGKAGRSLAAAAVRAGHHVVLEDVLPARLRDALEEIPTKDLPGTLELAGEVESAVRNADLAIDFVPDELESKLEIVSLIDRMAPPKTILCIPTAALDVTDLAACTYRADRCIGLVLAEMRAELQPAAETSAATLDRVDAFMRSLHYTVSVVQHAPATAVPS